MPHSSDDPPRILPGIGRALCLAAALSCVLIAGCDKPTSSSPSVPSVPSVPIHEPFVMKLDHSSMAANPFDQTEAAVDVLLTHESGDTRTLPAFWNQDYTYALSKDGKTETLTARGTPTFIARFAPDRAGRYQFRWRITLKGGVREEPGGDLLATAPGGAGPVVRSPGTRYLMTASGEPVFLIGHNVGWSTASAPLADLLRYIDDLASSGQNCMRLWLCTWCLGFEHRQMGWYDLERAWKLDRVVEHARQRGVYIILCLENAHDVKEKKSPYWRTRNRPAGVIKESSEFFTHPEARAAFRNRLRYVAARWGYASSILAWEMFNEMVYSVLDPMEMDTSVEKEYFQPWLEEMGPALRRYDAHKHLITNSFATDRIWDEMNRFPWMDFVQHHTYLSSWDTDSADTVLNALRWVDDYGKPYLLGEFGGAPAGVYGAETNIVHDADPRGIHIHNSLWAASLSGAAGTPLNWWWDEYVRPKNLYHHYAALSRFLEGTPWLDAELKPEDLSTTHVRIRVLRGSTWARVWAQNREFTWPNAENLQGISRTESVPIWIEHLQPGTYGIQWWDTLQGVPLRSETKSCDGTLNLIVPPLQQDIAVRINLTAKE